MGGANNQKFGREGDLNSDPADCFSLKPTIVPEIYIKLIKTNYDTIRAPHQQQSLST